jgi:hypothetical protein
MAEHLFSNKSLVGKHQLAIFIGNWYEERLIKDQAFKKHPEEFIVLSILKFNHLSYETKNKRYPDLQAHMYQKLLDV